MGGSSHNHFKKMCVLPEEVNNMEENTEEALKQEAEEINRQAESPELEQTAEEVPTEEVEVATETEPEVTETDGEPKKGAQARIRELNTKANLAEERAKSLEERLAELTKPVGFQGTEVPQYNPQEPIVADGEEINITELNKRQSVREQKLLQTAYAGAQLLQKQSEAINRINSEANDVVRTYPELDTESEHFNKRLSEQVSKTVEKLVKANPYTTSVKEEVKEIMSLYKEGVTKEVGEATENIAKQVSESALRPTPSIKSGEKSDSELSTTELEAKYGVIY